MAKRLVSGRGLFHVAEAFAGDRFRPLFEVEHLDGGDPIVSDFLQRAKDRPKINVTKSRSLEVFIVAMEVGKIRMRIANDIRYRLGLDDIALTSRMILKASLSKWLTNSIACSQC